MGRIGFAARVVYGTGIFCTISPSERHGCLAIRVSRYREGDPVFNADMSLPEQPWIGRDVPSLEAHAQADSDEETCVLLPEYDVRRLIMARDPLAAVDSFTIYTRVVLAHLLGIRMCPDCPHCCKGNNPCQDIYGSNAEPQGGIFGRADALFGGVEAQKAGALHLHFFAYVQRIHQHKTIKEIADMLRSRLVTADALKQWHTFVCRETYLGSNKCKSTFLFS